MSVNAPHGIPQGDASQGLLPVATFATFPIPVVSGAPVTSGSGYRIQGNRTLGVNINNNSAATIWANPGGGGSQGIGIPVRPFTSKTFLVNTDYIGIFVGTPTLGTLSTVTQSISLTLSNVTLTPSEAPIQRPANPGIPQSQQSGAGAAQTITIAAATNTIITVLSLTASFSSAPAATTEMTVVDGGVLGVGTTIFQQFSTGQQSPPPPNLGPGLVGTVSKNMTINISAPGGAVLSDLSIITTQGPI